MSDIPKNGKQSILCGNKSGFTVNFQKPLLLDDREYAIGLVSFETVYRFPNIENGKNKLFYSPDKGFSFYSIEIDTGSYNIESLSSAIFKKMKVNSHYDSVNDKPYIEFYSNKNTGKVVMTLAKDYIVDFRRGNTFKDLIGFESKSYSKSINEGTNKVYIMKVKSIMINVDVVEGSFVNGVMKPVIYSFSPNVSPGFNIIENPRNIIYVKINQSIISYINVKITDQDGNLLDLRGEEISMRLHIK